jgi:hypothetical protein
LKNVLYNNFQSLGQTARAGSNNVILADEQLTNPLEILKQDLAINSEILFIEQQLYVSPDFEIVDGFTTFKAPQSASLALILLTSFWISILAGYLIIALWKFDRMLASYPTN